MTNTVRLLALVVLGGCTTSFDIPDVSDTDVADATDTSVDPHDTNEETSDTCEEETDTLEEEPSTACPCASDEVCQQGQCIPKWRVLEVGTYTIGSPSTELGRADDETQHVVTLTHDFAIQSIEVTQEQFLEQMGFNPSAHEDCPTCPVESVSWHEAAAYANALSIQDGFLPCYTCTAGLCTLDAMYADPYACRGYRLPTEAEWEFAARAGTETATYAGDLTADQLGCEAPNSTLDSIAWFCGNTTHPEPVAQLAPNAWGLYDILGNVFEFTHDCHDEHTTATDPWSNDCDRYVTRGGAWAWDGFYVRAAGRTHLVTTARGFAVGFRLVRTL